MMGRSKFAQTLQKIKYQMGISCTARQFIIPAANIRILLLCSEYPGRCPSLVLKYLRLIHIDPSSLPALGHLVSRLVLLWCALLLATSFCSDPTSLVLPNGEAEAMPEWNALYLLKNPDCRRLPSSLLRASGFLSSAAGPGSPLLCCSEAPQNLLLRPVLP